MKTKHHLGYSTFTPRDINAGVVIVHGMQEHHRRYDHFAKFLCKNGFLVRTYDLIGHGKSAKELGHLDSENGWAQLMFQLECQLKDVKSRIGDKPLYVIGHSMGSIITRTTMMRNQDLIDKVVLLGCPPPTSLFETGIIYNNLTRLIRGNEAKDPIFEAVFFGLGTDISYPHISWISKNQANVRKYKKDPYCGIRLDLGYYRNILIGLNDLSNEKLVATNPNLPIVILTGGKDPVVRGEKGINQTIDQLHKFGFKRVMAKEYPFLGHEILNEREFYDVYRDILAFLNF